MTDRTDVLRRAFDAIETLTAQLKETEARARDPIAIVGMACRFPGGVTTPDEYWALLRDGRSGIREIPRDRWDVDAWYDPDPSADGRMYTKHGGFLESIDTFDAAFFGISPREAATLDPQQRLLLECAWEAFEDAGMAPDRLANSQTGVYIGITTSDYARLLHAGGEDTDVYSASGTALNAAAGRISFTLGLQGPCMAIDTACSSSLVAAHTAVQALRARECDTALVGGVNAMVTPDAFVLFSKWGMIAAGDECRTFDADASGFVRGEGCGVLVLKRLKDAVAAGDRVVAVIRGSAVNQDGPSSGLSVPNGPAQAKVIRRALDNAGVKPHDIGFVEAHGTGTILGDPIEVEALGEVYGPNRPAQLPLMLGSAKPSIGHLESAAGVAGLMKLVLALRNQQLPPQRNFAVPNPRVDWDSLPIRVVTELQSWPTERRIGAVSGFGFSGTNVHIIVEEAPESDAPAMHANQPCIVPISARTDVALRESAQRIAAALDGRDATVADVARTLTVGRAELQHRAIVVASDTATLTTRLGELARGEPAAFTRTGRVTDAGARRVAFLYTGQGSQYVRMGLELRDAFPAFRSAFDTCDAVLRESGGPALIETLSTGDDARIHETAFTQPALFAIEYALTELFRSWGITPATVLGHSIGEYVAACAAGVISLEDALRLVAERGRLMQQCPTGGGMLAVAADAETAVAAAAAYSDRVSLAAINGPRDVVISGDIPALRLIAADLGSRSIDTKELSVSHAFHSPLMDPVLDPFEEFASRITLRAPTIPIVSNLSGRVDPAAGSSAAYWRRHIREPVAFEPSMRHLIDDGIRIFLELGPKPVLIGMARRFLTGDDVAWIPTLRARSGEVADVLEGVGGLFTAGIGPDWDAVLDGAGTHISLPGYPFQRRRHWISTSAGSRPVTSRAHAEDQPGEHPFLGHRIHSPLPEAQFECVFDPDRRPLLREHRVAGNTIAPAAAFIEIGHAAARATGQAEPIRLEDGKLRQALILEDTVPDVRLVVTSGKSGSSFEVFSNARDGAGSWTDHAGARITTGTNDEWLAVDVARETCTATVDIAEYHERMRNVGLEYGPSFRALSAASRGEQQAFGELHLPADDRTASSFMVHPGLIDAAFHLIGLALPEPAGSHFYIPVGYEAVDFAGPAGSHVLAHVTLRSADARRVIADVTMWDESGAPVLRVSGLDVRTMTREQFLAATGRVDRPGLLRTMWRDAPAASVGTGSWLITGGDDRLADVVAERLRAAGATVERMSDPAADAIARRVSGASIDGVIDLRTLELPAFATMTDQPSKSVARSGFADTLEMMRALAVTPPLRPLRIVLPTMAAQAVTADDVVEPMAAMVWGYAATVSAEMPSVNVRLIDLDDATVAATMIAASALRADDEDRLAARGGNVHVQRLVALGDAEPGTLVVPAAPYSLVMAERGTLDGLGISQLERSTAGAEQVEIEVLASGLNFRDVLNLLDMYPGPAGPLGNECCGIVTAVGDAVSDISVGDLVTCIAESTFSSHVVVDAAMTFRVPPQLSIAQAAAFPIAQLTAYLALHRVGHMRAGDRVLIHAGAGGVGLAAVHLALAAGADILASAGSQQKRDYLQALGVRVVFDSRTPTDAAAIIAATEGHGIDLLLNSLTGDFIDAGLRALAPGGRFLEIGLREVRTDDEIRAVRDDVSYHPLLLGDLCRREPEVVRDMYNALCQLLDDRRIPAPRTRAFPVSDSTAAFRYMAKARHIGRVAITHGALSRHVVRRDASYIVTGGLGELGLHVAEWLAAHNAGRIILTGRSAPGSAASERIERMRGQGSDIEIVRGDVANDADVALARKRCGLPVRGVIHAAGIVDDAAISRIDMGRFTAVLQPKVDGAYNIARATADDALDFLVLFSSGSALLGSPGQAAYSAANAFMDGLAWRLHADGHNAVSVNWGAWADGGMAAGIDDRTRREWATRGISALSARQGSALLADAIAAGRPQVAALGIDWTKFGAAIAAMPALLSELVSDRAHARSDDAPAEPSMRDALLALPARDRPIALAARLRREVAAVLGAAHADDIEPDSGLMEQGMDSLMAVELSSRLGRVFGVSLATTFAFEFPTMDALARHLYSEVVPAEADNAAPAGTVEIRASVADEQLESMSDAELEAELRRELNEAGF